MKLLFIGDPHLQISKFDLSCRFLTWIDDVVRDNRPDIVINLGDSFHNHAVLRSEILSEFKKHILHVTEVCPYIYVLGNHDFFSPRDSTYHALETFKGMRDFTVIDKTAIIHDITFVPYIPDHAQFPDITTDICVAHQTFIGADYGYIRTDVGVDADKVAADVIISGHIHKRQMFGKVIYPGTPFAQNVDDIDHCKGVMLFETDSFQYSFVDSPLPQWRGMRFELSQDLDVVGLHRLISENINSTDHWVIEVSGPKTELLAYIDSQEATELKNTVSIRYKLVYTDNDKNTRIKIKNSSMDDIISQYVDKVYQGSLDKTVIKTKALEILDKVRTF